jgi:hypothetical protein
MVADGVQEHVDGNGASNGGDMRHLIEHRGPSARRMLMPSSAD